MTFVLAIDAATEHAGLAIVSSGSVVGESVWLTRHNQTVELMPRLSALLTDACLTMDDIDVIGVCRGPGSYNGVRVGMATAKGLAYALDKPLVGVSTLMAEARRYPSAQSDIWSVLPLGRDYAVAGFTADETGIHSKTTDQALTAEDLAASLPDGCLVVGELPERLLESLSVVRPDLRYSSTPRLSRAVALGHIVLEEWGEGRSETAGSLQPLYLRRPQITPARKPLNLTGVPSAGVIWDMDGVIIDSADLHFISWREALSRHGLEMSRQQFDATFGRRNDDIIAAVAPEPVPDSKIKAIGEAKELAFRRLAAGSLRVFPGVMDLIKALGESGFRQAIASSAPPENISLVIEELRLKEFIFAVVDGTQVSRGKPDPEVFLKAAAALELSPDNCLVIEDAVAGVIGARQAGMAVLAVSNTHGVAALADADRVTDTLQVVDVASILEMINRNQNKKES
ncbi:HAD-superfamily hydrolase, subfamily IA, variant 3 [Dehalogenimonas lykanthroporepellens BL-DC-9]|nr:HAD-superfamily hydrolase, subfamily IA, variant 3 [Dehalogenimonas lykanthroporepellens BL-DC-9]